MATLTIEFDDTLPFVAAYAEIGTDGVRVDTNASDDEELRHIVNTLVDIIADAPDDLFETATE